MNFYPIYRNKKILPWIKWWLIKGNKIAPKHLSEWINSAEAITLTGVYKGSPLLFLNLNGNTSQDGTPTPEAPVPVNVVKGNNTIKINDTDYQINLKSKNLFDKNNLTVGYLTESGNVYNDPNYRTSDFIPIEANTDYYKTYTISPRTKYYNENKQALNTTTYQDISIGGNAGKFTTPANAYFVRFSFPFSTSGQNVNPDTIQIEKGSQPTTYEPYYDYELCKIGTYQDVIYKDTDGKYYVEKYVGKIILDGSEDWQLRNDASTADGFYTFRNGSYIAGEFITNSIGYSNYFEVVTSAITNKNNLRLVNTTNYGSCICISENLATDRTQLKSWLTSHNIMLYYILPTSETTEITETNLVNQLESIYNAKLNSGTNTITQLPADLPFYLNFQYYEKG